MKRQVYFQFANGEQTHRSEVHELYEKEIQGWLDTGSVTLREYNDGTKNTVVLRFVESFTTSEQERVINQLTSVKTPSKYVIEKKESLNPSLTFGDEVSYAKASLTVKDVENAVKTMKDKSIPYAQWANGRIIYPPSGGYAAPSSAPINPSNLYPKTPSSSIQPTQKTMQEIIDEAKQICKKYGVKVND